MDHKKVKSKLHLIVIKDTDGTIAGIFPFYEWKQKGMISHSELRPLGYYGSDEGMAEELIYLIHPEFESFLPHYLFLHLNTLAKKIHSDLTIYQYRYHVRHTQPTKPKMLGSFQQEEGRQVVYLPNSWKEYFSSLSKSMRGNLHYYPHRLEKAGYTYNVRILTKPSEMEEGIDHLIRLHHHRATSTRGPKHINHIPTSCHQGFLLDCWTALSKKHQASVFLMEINGEVIAVQAMLHVDDEFTFYYSGFDTAWYDYSPLTILTAHIIADAIKSGVKRLNLLANPAFFRSRWGAQTETMRYSIFSVNPNLSSVVKLSLRKLPRHQ